MTFLLLLTFTQDLPTHAAEELMRENYLIQQVEYPRNITIDTYCEVNKLLANSKYTITDFIHHFVTLK